MKSFNPVDHKLIFFGTPLFAIPTLEALHREGYQIKMVITQPDKPVGRGRILTATPLQQKATALGLPVFQPVVLKSTETARILSNSEPALAVIVAYGKIIPSQILNIPPQGCINLHPSLLPHYRGPSPIQSVILNGETETGVSVMLIDAEMDHGPLLAQERTPIDPDETSETLHQKLALLGAQLMVRTVMAYLRSEIVPQKQDHHHATFCKLINKKDGMITSNDTSEIIYRKVRALSPWPGVFMPWNGKTIKLHQVKPASSSLNREEFKDTKNGEFFQNDGHLYLKLKDSSLEIFKLQLEGKNKLMASDFIHGYLHEKN